MQEPGWEDVFAYLQERLREPHSSLFWAVLTVTMVSIIRAVVGALWQRHVQHQRVALVTRIFERWLQQCDKPLRAMPADKQLAAIDRLGSNLLGRPAVVVSFLMSLRAMMESWQADERVLAALDALAQTWHDKLPSDRKRRERRARVLARRDVDRLVNHIARDGVRGAPPS
jgi:hypothetical protein